MKGIIYMEDLIALYPTIREALAISELFTNQLLECEIEKCKMLNKYKFIYEYLELRKRYRKRLIILKESSAILIRNIECYNSCLRRKNRSSRLFRTISTHRIKEFLKTKPK